MKNLLTICFIIFFMVSIYGQSNIKWEETFNGTSLPSGWQVIDNDGSGSGLGLFSSVNLTGGTTVLPQAGMGFWFSNYQNASLAGVIDEWVISPQISVIYVGDSLYFWAGAMGGPFNDSLRVWVSSAGNQISDFTHRLGNFKVDGPAGSWHRYGFDLSPFDSSDIHVAVNYYIRDGGPGGQHSDAVWFDHFMITGDPSTINIPPSEFSLLSPADGSLLHPRADTTLQFQWSAASDGDSDPLRYTLTILDVFPPLLFSNIADTTFLFDWRSMLNHWSAYRWTMRVTDGKSTVQAPDTFIFITPPIDNLAPLSFGLVSPADGDTLAIRDSLQLRWHPAIDPNSDPLSYELSLIGTTLDTTFTEISDTSFSFPARNLLKPGMTYQWEVVAADSQYSTPCNAPRTFTISGQTDIAGGTDPVPAEVVLYQNYPNPFNPTTVISWQLPVGSPVNLSVYNIVGQKITELINEIQPPGKYSIEFQAEDLPSGVYYYRLQAGTYVETRKMILMQ